MPTSGAGAAIHGGRFNPKGMAALDLALTIEACSLKVSHGFAHRFPPLTVVTYDVDCADICDLTTEAGLKAAGTDLSTLGCAWMLDRAEGRVPPHERWRSGSSRRGPPARWCRASRPVRRRGCGIGCCGGGAGRSGRWWRGMRRGGWGEAARTPPPHQPVIDITLDFFSEIDVTLGRISLDDGVDSCRSQ
ncbi:MAG: RES domain-containing protein [Xanthobacteraceae bacterium]|nr:MAG: RES domain-containing protein [Xanthobacteraceae bacterium]